MQRIFKCNDIENTSDKDLNMLIYGTPSYGTVLQEFLKFRFFVLFGPPCISHM